MKINIAKTSLLTIAIFFSFGYGIVTYKYQAFPYSIIQGTYHQIKGTPVMKEDWSIGIYEGDKSPFELTPAKNITNPVLTKDDVTDVEASFIADPFLIHTQDKYFIFFEVYDKNKHKGDIGYAVSSDMKKWQYGKIVIDEPFHLSYPHVFKWEGDYYLVPESNEDFSVRLYKATSFPDKWEYQGNLLAGYNYVDPTVFRYNNKWWMFVSPKSSNVLNLYYSDDLLGEWRAHPSNPIIKNDKHISRSAGRVLIHNDKVYRFAQDDYPYYGKQVYAFEITELSDSTYSEKPVSNNPILSKTGKGWNGIGMHQIDVQRLKNKWFAVVDGKK